MQLLTFIGFILLVAIISYIATRETENVNRNYNLNFDTRITTRECEVTKIRETFSSD